MYGTPLSFRRCHEGKRHISVVPAGAIYPVAVVCKQGGTEHNLLTQCRLQCGTAAETAQHTAAVQMSSQTSSHVQQPTLLHKHHASAALAGHHTRTHSRAALPGNFCKHAPGNGANLHRHDTNAERQGRSLHCPCCTHILAQMRQHSRYTCQWETLQLGKQCNLSKMRELHLQLQLRQPVQATACMMKQTRGNGLLFTWLQTNNQHGCRKNQERHPRIRPEPLEVTDGTALCSCTIQHAHATAQYCWTDYTEDCWCFEQPPRSRHACPQPDQLLSTLLHQAGPSQQVLSSWGSYVR